MFGKNKELEERVKALERILYDRKVERVLKDESGFVYDYEYVTELGMENKIQKLKGILNELVDDYYKEKK